MTVSIITCTGFRPEALALCQKFIEWQNYKGQIQWIVVKDESTAHNLKTTKKNITIEQYYGPKLWEPDYNTQRSNMEFAMTKVKGDFLLIFEDDDFYKPNYIQTYVDILKHVEAVGITFAKYYHLKVPGWKVLHNDKHASLASTGVSKWGIPYMVKAINSGDMYIDRAFWQMIHENKRPNALIGGSSLMIGIKGMVGRQGITPSHKELRDYQMDVGCVKLQEWIQNSYELYAPYSKRIQKVIDARFNKVAAQRLADAEAPLSLSRATDLQAVINKL